MIVAIHQPNYLPWMGFFDKMAKADVFVIFDDVQLPRGGHCYETRCTIRTKTGPLDLNVPVENRGGQLIRETRLAQGRWRSKHWRSIELAYGYDPELANIYQVNYSYLVDFNLALIRVLAKRLGITTPLLLSSQLGVNATGTDKILGIVKDLGADTYISGTGAGSRRYVSEETFADNGIKVIWHTYDGPNFSAVDHLFHKQYAQAG